jgi:hypothetical protein
VYQQGIASNNATYPLLFPSSLLSMSLMYSVVDDDNDAVLDFPMPNIFYHQRILLKKGMMMTIIEITEMRSANSHFSAFICIVIAVFYESTAQGHFA